MRREHIGRSTIPFLFLSLHEQSGRPALSRLAVSGPSQGGRGSCGGEVLLAGHFAGVEDYVYRDWKMKRMGREH